jgi:hypothetical protein
MDNRVAPENAGNTATHQTDDSSYSVAFGLVAVTGLALVLVSSSGVVHDLGLAALIAGVVAFPMDLLARRSLQADAFRASFGYLLADPLREELRWLLGIEVLCTEHRLELAFDDVGDGVVKLSLRQERVYDNLTPSEQRIDLVVHAADWHVPGRKSTIDEITWNGQPVPYGDEPGEYSIVGRGTAPALLGRGPAGRGGDQTRGRAVLRTTEWRRYDDQFSQVYLTATENPRVVISAAPAWMRFAIAVHFLPRKALPPGVPDPTIQQLTGPGEKQFEGTLLPLASIDVRWWRATTN